MERAFLLSPANSSGKRGQLLLREDASFPVAVALRNGRATIGQVYSFISGLYFRGKMAYAARFAPDACWVITPGAGLLRPGAVVSREWLREMASVSVDPSEPRFVEPLERDAAKLKGTEVVLLGSIATGKYVQPLGRVLGEALLFPAEFVGRGDMSRGGLMLRCAESGVELEYIPVASAIRRGKRPPKLPARKSC